MRKCLIELCSSALIMEPEISQCATWNVVWGLLCSDPDYFNSMDNIAADTLVGLMKNLPSDRSLLAPGLSIVKGMFALTDHN